MDRLMVDDKDRSPLYWLDRADAEHVVLSLRDLLRDQEYQVNAAVVDCDTEEVLKWTVDVANTAMMIWTRIMMRRKTFRDPL